MDSAALFSACGAKADETLGYTDFLTLCPILIYQLDFHTCQSSHFHQETLNNKRERPLSRWTAAESECLLEHVNCSLPLSLLTVHFILYRHSRGWNFMSMKDSEKHGIVTVAN